MSHLVRVRDARTGHQYTTATEVVESDPSRYRVLDKPATDASGRPLAPKFTTTPAPDGPEPDTQNQEPNP